MQNLQTTPARPLMPYQGKPLLHFDSLLLRRALLLCFFVGLFFLIPAAMADDALTLPVGDMKIPGAEGGSWSKMLTSGLRWGLVIFTLVAFGIGLVKSIITLHHLVNDARNNGEWGPAIQQLCIVMLIVAMTFVILTLENKYVLEPLGKLG